MNRRGFLSLMGLGAAGMALDPERLLWVPGAKTIFVPPVVKPTYDDILGVTLEHWATVIRIEMRRPMDFMYAAIESETQKTLERIYA